MRSRLSEVAALGVVLLVGALIGFGCSESAKQPSGTAEASAAAEESAKPKRFGMVIGLRPEKKGYYNELHADPWPEINSLLKECNIGNYSIYECELDGKLYLFAYFEYTGDDFEADTAKMKADPKMQQWWAETDPCQIRLPGTPEGEQWLAMEEVYRLD